MVAGREEGRPGRNAGGSPAASTTIGEVLGVPSSRPWGPQNVEHDRGDGRLWSEMMREIGRLRRLAGNDAAPATFPALLRDLWAIFYKVAPRFVPEGEVDPAHRRGRPLLERILGAEETEHARVTTCRDELLSALAVVRAAESLLEEARERPALREAFFAEEIPPPDTQEGPAPEEPGVAPTEGLPGSELPPPVPPMLLRRAARAAAGAADKEASGLEATLSGWGLSGSDLARVPLGERLKLLETLRTPRMGRLAEVVGRMRNVARAGKREKAGREPDELHSLGLGRDLSRVLPQEIALLKRPGLKREFHRRFSEGRLLCYDLKTDEPQGKGPLIALVDSSGSMRGSKMDWATAVALALVETAVFPGGGSGPGGREAAILFFGTRLVQETRFSPGEKDARKLLEVASVGGSGGTDYRPALDRAAEVLREERRFSGADVVLITDALCRLPEGYVRGFLECKAATGFSLHSVLIGQKDEWNELSRYSDRVWEAGALSDRVAAGVFGAVSTTRGRP